MTDESAARLTIGVDLGGTKVETALVDHAGRILGRSRVPSRPEAGGAAVIATIAAAVQREVDRAGGAPVHGVGVGVAGQVDPATGTVRHATNLHFNEFPLRERLTAALDGLPVTVLNDVQAATYGEWRHGAGRGVANLVTLFVGTGVGGGVVVDGRLLRGASGSLGEIGHTTVQLHGRRCRCGNMGCVEAYAGGWAIAARAAEAVAADRARGRRLLELAGGRPDACTAGMVGKAAAEGDPLARLLVDEAAAALGAAVASVVNAFNPSLVILGGGVADGIPELVERAAEAVAVRALPAARDRVRLVRPALGLHAGTVGAAAWARVAAGEDAAGAGVALRPARKPAIQLSS
jgi:glucokinase